MPPKIALLLCTVFVLFLLRLERKEAPEVSFALWVPTVWMLLIATKPLGLWFGVGGEDMESGSPLDRAVLSGIFCLGLLILAKRRFIWSNAIKKNIFLMLLLGYMLISIFWSDMPFVSFKRWVREFIAIVMAFMVATELDPKKAVESIFRRTIYVLIPFSYMLIHYFPKYGREYGRWSGVQMWVGVAMQKNGLGRLCLFATFFLIWAFITRRQKKNAPVIKYQNHVEVFILLMTFWLMGGPQHNFSYSVTTNVAFAAGLIALIGLFWMKKRNAELGPKALIVIVALIICYGTFTPMIGKLSVIDISTTFGRDETLTGRSDIWTTLVPYAMQKPILGYGHGGFWTDAMRQLTSSHAHNGYLDVVLNLGFVGLLLFIIFLMFCSRKAQKIMIKDFDWGVLLICFLLIIVVHNIAESSFTSFTSHLLAVILFLVVSLMPTISNSPRVSKK